MKKKDVQIGKTYIVRVSGQLVPVRLQRESEYGGWWGLSIKTNRMVRIKTAAKLRLEYVAPAPKDWGPVETHEVAFGIASYGKNLDAIRRVCDKTTPKLEIDPGFSADNGGVTKSLRITGPRKLLVRLAKLYGYPDANPDLVPPTALGRLLMDQ